MRVEESWQDKETYEKSKSSSSHKDTRRDYRDRDLDSRHVIVDGQTLERLPDGRQKRSLCSEL